MNTRKHPSLGAIVETDYHSGASWMSKHKASLVCAEDHASWKGFHIHFHLITGMWARQARVRTRFPFIFFFQFSEHSGYRSLFYTYRRCSSAKLSRLSKVTQLLNVGVECELWSSDLALQTIEFSKPPVLRTFWHLEQTRKETRVSTCKK